MSIFDSLESLTKAAIGAVTLPVTIVADVVTLGGSLTEKDKPYTAEAVSDIMKNLKDATKP